MPPRVVERIADALDVLGVSEKIVGEATLEGFLDEYRRMHHRSLVADVREHAPWSQLTARQILKCAGKVYTSNEVRSPRSAGVWDPESVGSVDEVAIDRELEAPAAPAVNAFTRAGRELLKLLQQDGSRELLSTLSKNFMDAFEESVAAAVGRGLVVSRHVCALASHQCMRRRA